MIPKRLAWPLFAGLILFFTVFFFLPVGLVLRAGFTDADGFTLAWVARVFKSPVHLQGLLNSLTVALATTLLATLWAVPPAWCAHRFDFPGKKLFNALMLVPMILPPFVGAIGILQILGPYGALNAILRCGPVDWLALSPAFWVSFLQSLALYPLIYLNFSASLAGMDPALEEAARSLGASPWRIFRTLTLPLAWPGFFAGAILVFIAAFTELGTPMLLSYNRCAAVQIYDELAETAASPFPFALVGVVMILSVALYAAARFFLDRARSAGAFKPGGSTHAPAPLRGAKALLPALCCAGVAALALLPHLGVILVSLTAPGSWYRSILPDRFTLANYTEALGQEITLASIRNSLFYALGATAVAAVAGVLTAWIAHRAPFRRLRGLPDLLAMLPLAVPGIVTAFGFLALSRLLLTLPAVAASPTLSRSLDAIASPWLFLIFAYAIRRLPYLARAASAGFQQSAPVLEEAARNLGAGVWTTLRRITLPLIGANLFAGMILTFAFCMLEVSDSLILAQKEAFYPVTKAIFELYQLLGTGPYTASALGVWAMLLLTAALAGGSLILGKRLGALFRA